MELPSSFASLLRHARQEAGLTQEELAERARLSCRAISDLERGVKRPRRDTVTLLAEALALAGEGRAAFDAAARRPIPVSDGVGLIGDDLGTRTDSRVVPLPAGMLTFLITDVRGYTAYTHQHGDEAGAALATRFAALAGKAVTAHEGLVVEVRGDEVMAVFTSARRALRAAVDLLARCAAVSTLDLPLKAGAGLDVGEPISVPGGYRGEVINVAARLCAKAGPGEVLASDAVVSLARRIDGLLYEERGPLELKGLSRPVRAWLVRDQGVALAADQGTMPGGDQERSGADPGLAPTDAGTPRTISADPDRAVWPAPETPDAPRVDSPLPVGGYLGALPLHPLVAREDDLARLTRGLAAASSGSGQMLLLAGEPGVGKTRLAQEIMLQARAAGMAVLIGCCQEEQIGTPYSPLDDALRAAWARASPALRNSAPERFSELGRLLPQVLPTPPATDGDDARRGLLRAMAGFLSALAGEQPLALLLDDLHWANSAGLDALAHLAHALRADRVFILGTYRDVEVGRQHPLEATLTSLIRDRVVEVVTLRGLTAEGTAALITSRVGTLNLSDTLRDRVHDRTEGNPFFTEEVLAALLEQGAILDGSGERSNADRIAVPHSIRSVIGQRIARLAPGVQELLRLASVLGQEFDLDLLVAAADEPEPTVLDHLEAALVARLVEERRRGRTERYAFVHALISQTLYDETPRFRLRRLHLRAAEALERARGAQSSSAADLARHLLAGGAEERALPYLERAGDSAAALDAHVEAVGHFQTAVELRLERGESVEAAAIQRKLGIELTRLLRIPEALVVLNAALATYERAEDTAARAQVHGNLARAYLAETEHDYQAAMPHLRQALDLWPLEQEDHDLGSLLRQTAGALVMVGDRAEAASFQERLTTIADRRADPGLQASALLLTIWLNQFRGDSITQWFDLEDRAVALAEQAEDRAELARALGARATTRYLTGNIVAAVADLRRAVSVAEGRGSPQVVVMALFSLSGALSVQGQWAEARTVLQRGLALQPSPEISRRLAWLRGHHEEALRLGQESLQTLRTKGTAEFVPLEHRNLADLCLQLGRWSDAYTLARDALTFIQARQLVALEPGPRTMLAEAAAAMRAPDAAATVAEATAALDRQGYEAYRPRVLRARAHLLHGQGDPAGALACLQECAALVRRQGNVVELAMTLALLAEVARDKGDDTLAREADAERAAIVERIGPEARGLAWAR